MTRGLRIDAALGALAVASACLFSTPASAQVRVYTARLERPATRTGAVVALGITWQCQDNVCTTSGPWLAPGVGACAALAAEVGRIAAYGREGLQLSADNLARCNASAPQNVVRAPILPPLITGPVLQRPIIRTSPAPTPAPEPEPTPTPAPTGTPVPADGVINTPELYVVGGVYTTPPPDIGPVTVASRELFVVGGAYTPPGADIAPVTVDVPELYVVGAGPPLPSLTHR